MNIKNQMGTIDTIRYEGNINIDDLVNYVKEQAEKRNISVNITKDVMHSGGLFTGHDYPCVVFSHPNPPQRYFDQVWVINNDLLNRYFWGLSTANTKVNTYNDRMKNGNLLDHIIGSISGSAEMELQVEHEWQQSVMDLIKPEEVED